jgi:hypothetical protein
MDAFLGIKKVAPNKILVNIRDKNFYLIINEVG